LNQIKLLNASIFFVSLHLLFFPGVSFAGDVADFQSKVDRLNQDIDQLQTQMERQAAQLKTLNQKADLLAPKMQAECTQDETSEACQHITEEAHVIVEQAKTLQNEANQNEAQLQQKLMHYQKLMQEAPQY